jgi:hypothetical protein
VAGVPLHLVTRSTPPGAAPRTADRGRPGPFPPDPILLNYVLPGVHSNVVCRTIRNSPGFERAAAMAGTILGLALAQEGQERWAEQFAQADGVCSVPRKGI